jgi:ketosteroid isomerase-like protein
MSRENVEVVRRIYDAAARRDDMTPFEIYAEDIVWDVSRLRTAFLYTRPTYRGHEGVRQVWREGLAAFGQIDMEPRELVDAGDHVVAVVHEREIGRTSGAPVEAAHAAVWTLAEGRITRVELFDDRAQALEAVGLQE